MNRLRWIALAIVALVTLGPTPRSTLRLDTASIEALTGAKGKLDEREGVFKVSLPRSDLDVRAAGVRITLRAALDRTRHG